jgi:hypothetical protein
VERDALTRGHEAARDSRGPRRTEDRVQPGTLAWASAVGNAAVQRLARQATAQEDPALPEPAAAGAPPGVETQGSEEAVEGGAPPPEVAALEAAGIGQEALAGLEAVDQLGEGALPE